MSIKTEEKTHSYFTRTPRVALCLDGFSEGEKLELAELLEGMAQLAIPFFKVDEFNAEALNEYDATILAEAHLHDALAAGIIPIAIYAEAEGAEDYNAVKETGNGFYYRKKNHWNMFAAFIRMMENFQFPYDWANLKKITAENAEE